MLVESDFQERYGVDLSSGILRERTGRWLRDRLLGLLTVESRLRFALFPSQRKGG